MKNLNFTQMESLNGGLCVEPLPSGNCLPCPAILVVGVGNMGGFGERIICIA